MKNKMIVTALTLFLATPQAFSAYLADGSSNTLLGLLDDADDTQAINIIVPEVALIDINDLAVVNLSALTPPTKAGDGFTGSSTASTDYSISSNISNSLLANKRSITVQVQTGSTIPEGSTLNVNVTAPTGGTDGTATLTSTTTSDASATNIGNTRGSNLAISYEFVPDTTGMIAYTPISGETISLLYTLTDD